MNMQWKTLIVGVCLGMGAVGIALTQESPAAKSDQAAKPDQAAKEEQEAIMKKWMEFMTPGAEHELLKYKEGKWSFKMEMWMAPGAEPSVTEGTSEAKLIMGGRYLLDNSKATFNNMPYEGMGIVGYDKLLNKFISVWIDNMGTGLLQGTGTYDETTKTYTYTTMAPDVMVGNYKQGRTIERVLNDDRWVMEMYDTTPDGKEFVTMKGEYTRVK
jgi:hypothetical protein